MPAPRSCESGLDIPGWNTICWKDAPSLAWRSCINCVGRVGRSGSASPRLALLIRAMRLETEAPGSGLRAIQEFQPKWGSGLPAGDARMKSAASRQSAWGGGRSGQMETIGFESYMEIAARKSPRRNPGQDIPAVGRHPDRPNRSPLQSRPSGSPKSDREDGGLIAPPPPAGGRAETAGASPPTGSTA